MGNHNFLRNNWRFIHRAKNVAAFLSAVGASKALMVTNEVNENVVKSARNIPGVLTTPAVQLNVYDIINAQYLVVDQAALAKIEEVYA